MKGILRPRHHKLAVSWFFWGFSFLRTGPWNILLFSNARLRLPFHQMYKMGPAFKSTNRDILLITPHDYIRTPFCMYGAFLLLATSTTLMVFLDCYYMVLWTARPKILSSFFEGGSFSNSEQDFSELVFLRMPSSFCFVSILLSIEMIAIIFLVMLTERDIVCFWRSSNF